MYVVSGWGQHPAHPPAWQGAFFYEQEPGRGQEVRGTDWHYCTGTVNTSCVQVNGTYVYPDWSSCVAGTWRDHVLVQGHYCRVTTVCEGAVHTRPTRPAPRLTYSPPSYHNTGATPTLMDPFENNTVRCKYGDVVV